PAGATPLLFVDGNSVKCHTIPVACPGLRPTTKLRETNMTQLLKLSAAPITMLSALAFVTMATPASAGEYCRKDVTSAVVSCSFDTLAQCQEMSSGRGGDCYRDPFLPTAG